MRKLISFICLACGKADEIGPSQFKHYKGAGRFCTRDCHYSYYRNNPEKSPLHKTWTKDSSGYLSMKVKCIDGVVRRERQHRFLMEIKVGRRLSRNEHVHHINGIKTDNRMDNLDILSASDHHKHHGNTPQAMAALDKAHVIQKRMWSEWKKSHWAHDYTECIACHTKEVKHQGKGLCKKCYLKNYQLVSL